MIRYLATEDELSEAAGVKLLQLAGLEKRQIQPIRKQGNGYLKSRMAKWIELARTNFVFLITDLDDVSCAPELRNNWMNGRNMPERMVFRVAVREIEAWLLADHVAMRDLIGPKGRLPNHPDELDDPKRELLSLAIRSPKKVRNEIVRQSGSHIRQGFGYSNILCEWVAKMWDPARAASRSNSLERAPRRLSEAIAKSD